MIDSSISQGPSFQYFSWDEYAKIGIHIPLWVVVRDCLHGWTMASDGIETSQA